MSCHFILALFSFVCMCECSHVVPFKKMQQLAQYTPIELHFLHRVGAQIHIRRCEKGAFLNFILPSLHS